MSKIISTNKLNRLWVNGIKPTVDKVKNTIKDRSGLMSNTDENKLVDALAIKEAIEHHDMFTDNITCGSLDEFLQKTAVKINLANHSMPAIGRVKDTTGWGPNKVSGLWYRFIVLYQNGYSTSINDNINGNGIFWTDNDMWNVVILGTQSTGFTSKYERVNKPTITSRADLMANEVSGLFPDALAVKDAVKLYDNCKYSSKQYATLEEFVTDIAGNSSYFKEIPFNAGLFRDTTGWGPKKPNAAWYKYMIISQNSYVDNQQHPTSIDGVFMDEGGKIWFAHIYGKKDEGMTVTYTLLNKDEPVTTDISSQFANIVDTSWESHSAIMTKTRNVVTIKANFKYNGNSIGGGTIINGEWAGSNKISSFVGYLIGYDHNFATSIFCVTSGSNRIGVNMPSSMQSGKNYSLNATVIIN